MNSSSTLEPLDLRYPGGKGLAGLWQWICSLQPPHVYYHELAVGKGGVFRKKTPALHSTLIDRDPAVIRWWQSQHPRVTDPIAGIIDARNGSRTLISHTTLICGCGIEYLERLADEDVGPEHLVYADFPYHPSTRSKYHLQAYTFELSDRDHRRFLKAARRVRCPMMISGYRCELYLDRLHDWKLETRMVITRGRTMAEECVWINCEAAEARAIGLQYHELGTDYRERDRVNKLRKRWGADFRQRAPSVAPGAAQRGSRVVTV